MSDNDPPVRLRDVERCFLGAVPASIATCSPEGIPNVTFLSIVHFIDDSHLGLSFQFFNKTRENIQANPRAQVLLQDPVVGDQFRVDVRYERTEHAGPLFERMRVHLDAVASHTGMQDIFRLQGIDVYEVLAIETLAHDLDLRDPVGPKDFVAGLEALSTRVAACEDLESLLDTALSGLAELFDYQHSIVLLTDPLGTQLYTVASRGFPQSGIGAEVAFGDGVIGMAAQEKRPIRVGNVVMDSSLAEAARTTARERGRTIEEGREIAPPGPVLYNQLAVPMLVRDRVLGVLCVQNGTPGHLRVTDEQALATLARFLATSIQLIGQMSAADAPPARADATPALGASIKIRRHASDDSIFFDDEYLIKGVPGRILLRLLEIHERDGRVEFTNKELRVDASLKLGIFRDNLEARLILLRRRLDERGDAIRLVPAGRGRFRLELRRPFTLTRAE